MKVENNFIWNTVKDLLHEHDCVIVPGFGGFVCNLQPARIDQISHIITPPAKHLVFNQNLKTNDGLLASRMAEQLKINYSEAIQLIDETVDKTKDFLQDKKYLTVELFGSFRLNADANYVFLPEKNNNFLYTSFGLMPLQADPVASRSIKTRKARVFKDRKELRTAKNVKRTKNTIRIAVGAFAILLAVNLFIFIKDPELKISATTMNITSWFDSLFHSSSTQPIPEISKQEPIVIKEETYIPPPPAPIENNLVVTVDSSTIKTPIEEQPVFDILSFAKNIALAKGNFVMPITAEEQPIVETPDNGKQQIVQPILKPSALTDSTFYIIGGVFCKQKYAQRFFHELEEKGFAPEIVPNPNMNCNRVSYAKFFSRKDAERQLHSIHANINADAWLLVQHN